MPVCTHECRAEIGEPIFRDKTGRTYFVCRECKRRISVTVDGSWHDHGTDPFEFEDDYDFGFNVSEFDFGF